MLQVQILSPLASHVGYLNVLTSLTFMRSIITWMQPISLEVYFMPLIEMFHVSVQYSKYWLFYTCPHYRYQNIYNNPLGCNVV